MPCTGADLEIYERWGCVIFAREIKTTPTFTSTSPTLYNLPRTSNANARIQATSHESPQIYISAIGSAGDKLAL